MNNVLPSLTMLFRKSRRSLVYGSIAALTVGLEGLFESIVFNCPCEGHYAYGLAFLWAPALLLFLAGFLVDRDLWRHPRRDHEKEKKTLARRYFKALIAALDVLIRASIAPVAWLVLSFLQQQYYTCAYFGPPLDSDVIVFNTTHECHFKLGSRTKALEESYKTRSQIAGWSLMLVAMSVLFASVCIRRCIQKGKHLQIPSLEYYHHVEAKAALEQFHATAKEQAKEKAKKEIMCLFVNAADKDFISRIQDVGKGIENKYGPFLEIPPESPSYTTPVSATRDPPQFSSHPSIERPLLVSGSETDSPDAQRSVCVTSPQFSPQMYSAPGNPSGLARVRLYRQESFDTSRK
ncbi:calcium homeostasis modulator protein 6-like [Oculina patagonica]